MSPTPLAAEPLAVLCSGGVDSAVLLSEALYRHPAVWPIYVRTGAQWEKVEQQFLNRFLNALARPLLKPLVVLDQPVADLYGNHWSVTGKNVPDHQTPDEAVFLPSRNVLLLVKPMLWCHLNDVPQLALAPLAANPFPDATPEFFKAFEKVANESVAGRVRIFWPYLYLKKAAVVRRGRDLPLQHTFSCIRPSRGRHCGTCNKCAERKRAFAEAGVADPTKYSA